MKIGSHTFREIWCVDFEFSAPSGEIPEVICLVAWELVSNRKLRIWQDELEGMDGPPYAIDADALFVAYYASAEMGCHLALGWELPENVLDLFTEFRSATNGLKLTCGAGLLLPRTPSRIRGSSPAPNWRRPRARKARTWPSGS